MHFIFVHLYALFLTVNKTAIHLFLFVFDWTLRKTDFTLPLSVLRN